MNATTPLVFNVEGMHCASCVGRVEKALRALPGVQEATVNLPSETATVTGVSATQVVSAITSAGFKATPHALAEDLETRKTAEAEHLWRMTLMAALLTLPVFLLEMLGHAIPAIHEFIHRSIGMQTSWLIQFLLTTTVLAVPGRQFFVNGVPALLRRAPDMNSLVALGTSAAWGFSTVATFAPQLLPEGARAVYFEAAAVIVTLILLGRTLEARAKGRTGAAIRKLVGLQPRTARVARKGEVVEIPLAEIVVGDLIHVRPGEKVAVDGVVIKGASFVDEAMITGEPIPVEKSLESPVTGGTINGAGALVFRATAVGADTMLARIIAMVEQAQGARLPVQELVNKITGWFVPVVMVLATVTVLAWLAFGPEPALGHALVAGVAVLIIACPCAMGLATPTSIMVGTGRAAEMGVLFRKGAALQGLQEARIVAFDKTGTLTQGRPELTDLEVVYGFDKGDVLTGIASVEVLSEHPISQAILRAATDKGLELREVSDFNSLTGFGVSAMVDGSNVLIGADGLFTSQGIALDGLAATGAEFAQQGKTPIYVAIDGQATAVLAVSDPIKPEAAATIKALQNVGLRTAMLTGDADGTAQAIAAQLGIDTVLSELLPADKVSAIAKLQEQGKTAFVGDGINDAPALASADTGIAIGTGTDIAIEAADVVLMSGDLSAVANAFQISHATMKNIRQNLFWAFGYNALLIPVAAGVFFPLAGVLLSPALAAGAMALSSVFVLSNALRLRFFKGTDHEYFRGRQTV